MSLLKAIKAQLGLSNTPANNFTITAEADNGTLKLARGNAGATTQDILTVDASGNVLVDGNNLNLFSAKSLASSGYQRLPSGLIIQWGLNLAAASGNPNLTVTLPIAFPNSTLFAGGVVVGSAIGYFMCLTATLSASQVQFSVQANGSISGQNVRWIAIGY